MGFSEIIMLLVYSLKLRGSLKFSSSFWDYGQVLLKLYV